MKYQVLVHGSVWFETDDVLLADAYAFHTRQVGWKNVTVKEVA
jgi:hypothetical protein